MGKNNINTKNNLAEIIVDANIYPMEAIYGASYIFVDKAYVHLDTEEKNKIIIKLKGKNKLSKKELEDISGEFQNELLNYTIRVKISSSNKKIRQYIVEQALYGATETEDDGFGFEDDPLGIAVPWEEKYGEKAAKKENKKIKNK